MKRIYVYFLAVAVLAVAGLVTTNLKAQQPAGGAPAATTAASPTNRGTTAVFNVARVMKDFELWQYYAATMNNERIGKTAELQKIRNRMLQIQEGAQKELVTEKKSQMEKELVSLQRQFEDMERSIRKEIDDASAKHLQQLFDQIRTVVERVAEVNGFQLVLAYPDAITDEERKSPIYYDLKLRPPAAMPFFVSSNVDITNVVVMTLNKHFPKPGPIPAPLTAAGATAPLTTPTPMK